MVKDVSLRFIKFSSSLLFLVMFIYQVATYNIAVERRETVIQVFMAVNCSFCFCNQGTGKYIYIETSSPRNPGDSARLEGPWMRGPQCMTFYYHMRGSTMSCVIIYIRSMATYRYKLVWLKSEDRGDHWIPGQISINTTEIFQVSSFELNPSNGLINTIVED